MIGKRFTLSKDTEWWFVQDKTIQVNEHGYREDLTGEDKYLGLKKELTEEETVELLNELYEENKQLKNFIMNLQNMIQFDVDNGIKTYPKALLEYLAKILRVVAND